MNPATPEYFEKLVQRVLDDLVDECSFSHDRLVNGSKVEAKRLVKDAIRIKQDLIDRTRLLKKDPSSNMNSEMKRLSGELRYHSFRILERMRELGI